MFRIPIIFALIVFAIEPVSSKDVPFAAAPSLQPESNNAYIPSLGEIMQIIQLKHIELWQAGTAMNWQLSRFEIAQIRDTFLRTAIFYDNLPVKNVMAVDKPLAAMQRATEVGDGRSFAAGYNALTAACNSCHRAANVGFIIILSPNSSPISDQKF